MPSRSASVVKPALLDVLGLKCEARIHLVLEVLRLVGGFCSFSVPGVPVESVVRKIMLIFAFINDVHRSRYEAGAHLLQEILGHLVMCYGHEALIVSKVIHEVPCSRRHPREVLLSLSGDEKQESSH